MNNAVTTILTEHMLPLDEVATQIFHLTPRIAQRKAATNTLPIPAFRIGGARKGPLYVLRDDLEKWIQTSAAKATKQHRKMQSV